MQINEHFIKLTGKATLAKELELGHSYKILLDGEVTTITDSNRQDGTKDRMYKFEPILAEITKENGETIKTKDTRSWSKKLRKVIYAIWMQNNSPIESEEYYERFMKMIIVNADEIASKIK